MHYADYPYHEVGLAQKMGLSRVLIAAFRKKHLQKGADWERVAGGIRYSPAGAEKIGRNWGVDAPTPAVCGDETSFAKKARLDAGPAQEIERVRYHSKPHNVKVVYATRESGEVITVRVNDSRNFVPKTHDNKPMTFRVRRVRTGWEFAEPRLPRWPGRW